MILLKKWAYYNEIDSAAAAHLRALIAAGHIAPGEVDERSIEDVTPADVASFAQCHWFAGIGIWSYALRAAGIADDTPIWTGSCPCQPFSAAGQGAGFDDERHLWPHFHYLIAQCKPSTVIGEQVASKDAGPWIDLVHTDMEALDYAFGAVPFPTAGIGGPHIRDRLYWVALGDPASDRREVRQHVHGKLPGQGLAEGCHVSGVAHTGCIDHRGEIETAHNGHSEADRSANQSSGCGDTFSKLGDPSRGGFGKCGDAPLPGSGGHVDGAGGALGGLADTGGERYDWCGTVGAAGEPGGGRVATAGHSPSVATPTTGPVNGFWADADWLYCRDDKWRPVEPGTQPLAYGMPRSMGAMSSTLQRLAEVAGLSSASLKRAKAYRVSALRGYGNAINAAAAQAFIEAVFK